MKMPMLFAVVALGVIVSRAEDQPTLDDARKKFEVADALLTTAYRETVAGLDKTKAAALKKQEAAWIDFREARSETLTIEHSPKISVDYLQTMEYWQTMIAYTEERTEFLKTYTGKNVSPGINGDYTDSVDGDLQLEERPEGLFFTFSVVRGRAANTGQLTGIAQRKGNSAHYKGDKVEGSKTPPCELTFTFIDGHIARVEEVSPDPEAGKGVHYDGVYYKKADSVIHD